MFYTINIKYFDERSDNLVLYAKNVLRAFWHIVIMDAYFCQKGRNRSIFTRDMPEGP